MVGRGMALVVSVAVVTAFAILIFNGIRQYFASDPAVAPICYGPEQAYTPRNEVIPLRGAPGERGGESIDLRRDKLYIEQVDQAEQECRVQACGDKQMRRYRSAIFWYLSGRLAHTRRLDREYGQVGLRRAREIYGEAADTRIERGLRERYRARVFRINDFTQYGDAVAIIVLAGGAALRPCRKGDIPA